MVALPELDQLESPQLQNFLSIRPIFARYYQIYQKEGESEAEKLRSLKHKYWLQCGYSSIHKLHSCQEIVHYWSQCADQLLKRAWKFCQLDTEPVSLLAFGKLGSQELNLSSDIDIVFVRDDLSDLQEIQPKIRKFIKLLNENTAFGFVFRVDVSLRPGGEHSPLAPTESHFLNFYNEYCEAWHRLSFIRLRPLCGPPKLNQSIMDFCQNVAYPRRLDFSIINEIKSIRKKINAQWKIKSESFDIKLAPGGIRDIEMYLQSLQVIYGGRNPQIQAANISTAMLKLSQISAITSQDYFFIQKLYWQLRSIENLIHLYEDQHSYLLKPEILPSFRNEDLRIDLEEKIDIDELNIYLCYLFSFSKSVETELLPQL